MKKALALCSFLFIAGAASSAVVTWQVHMDVAQTMGDFDPVTQTVCVRGYFNGWGGYDPTLTDAGGLLYTGSYDIAGLNPGDPIEYKYVIYDIGDYSGGSDIWECDPNNFLIWDGDPLLPEDWWCDITSPPGQFNAEVVFQVDMSVAEAQGIFDPGTDLVVIRGNHDAIGNWGGAVALSPVGGGIYADEIQFDNIDDYYNLYYKFVILEDGNPDWAIWEGIAENRLLVMDPTWPDTDADTYLEHTVPVVFFGDVSWDDVLPNDVVVTFNVDAWPIHCWFAEGYPPQGGLTSYEDVTFISVHGFFNGWPPWDGTIDPMYHALPAGGTLWSVDILFPFLSARTQVYKYGANGLDNEAGFAQDHVMFIDDGGSGLFTVDDVFGSQADMWDCEYTVDAEEQPADFFLAQNYPNPFNPGTTIQFSMDATAPACLTVYDLGGSVVATLVDGIVTRGEHEITFDASSLASGVYLYTLSSEGLSTTKKMILVK